MLQRMSAYVILIIAVALGFNFMNGFHDAANAIATVIATRVLSPLKAVIWAAAFDFIAAILAIKYSGKVADTVGKIVNADAFASIQGEMYHILFAALIGAIAWEVITWLLGLPVSASHALIGALAGSGLTAAWIRLHTLSRILNWDKIEITALFIVLSPLIGLILGYIIMVLILNIFRNTNPHKIDKGFRVAQILSAGAYSLGHGANDAQKTMGIIAIVYFSAKYNVFAIPQGEEMPLWIGLACASTIALGTMSGGWKVIKTMGMGITKLKPVSAFAAESAGAIAILFATFLGIPVSTTHTITGAIMGVGATHRSRAVRWGVAGRIVWAWIITMPAAALMSAVVYGVAVLFA